MEVQGVRKQSLTDSGWGRGLYRRALQDIGTIGGAGCVSSKTSDVIVLAIRWCGGEVESVSG